MLQSLHQTLSSTSMSFFTGHPEGKTILQVWPHQCLTEGMDQPLDLLTVILLTQLRILLTFFAMGVHLAHIHPGALPGPFLPSCFPVTQSPGNTGASSSPGPQNFALLLPELQEVPTTHFSSLPRLPWMAAQPLWTPATAPSSLSARGILCPII